jgi:hypothetical protein
MLHPWGIYPATWAPILLGLLFLLGSWRTFRRGRRLSPAALGLAALVLMGAGGAGTPIVLNNTQLGFLPSYQFAGSVLRLANTTLGDSPPAWYTNSGAACGIAGGDGGSQIPTADGKCWTLAAAMPWHVAWWGQASNPIQMYVATTGNNLGGANTCLLSAAPCADPMQAAAEANKFWAENGSVKVNMAAGTYTGVNVFQNGPLPGSSTTTPAPLHPTLAGFGPGMLAFVGAGSGSTIVGGGGDCSEFQASNFGIIAVQAMAINPTASCGIGLGVQQHGMGIDFGGVSWGAANFAPIWTEDAGYIALMGNDTVVGSSPMMFGCSGAGSEIQMISGAFQYTLTLSAGLTFSNAFFEGSNGCDFLLSGTSAMFPGSPSITGKAVSLYNNARMQNQTGIAFATLMPTATLPSILQDASSIFAAPTETVAQACTVAECGTGSTTTVAGTTRSGTVTLTAGTSASSSGGVLLANSIGLFTDVGSLYGVCTASLNSSGTGTWYNTSQFYTDTVTVSGNKVNLLIGFKNIQNGSVSQNFVNGDTYLINYNCSAS